MKCDRTCRSPRRPRRQEEGQGGQDRRRHRGRLDRAERDRRCPAQARRGAGRGARRDAGRHHRWHTSRRPWTSHNADGADEARALDRARDRRAGVHRRPGERHQRGRRATWTTSAFSKSGLIDQLEFEKYSAADARFAVNHIAVDWNEQAAKSAKSYLDYSSFSRQGLIDQLEFEGFTTQQAIYGVSTTGLWARGARATRPGLLREQALTRRPPSCARMFRAGRKPMMVLFIVVAALMVTLMATLSRDLGWPPADESDGSSATASRLEAMEVGHRQPRNGRRRCGSDHGRRPRTLERVPRLRFRDRLLDREWHHPRARSSSASSTAPTTHLRARVGVADRRRWERLEPWASSSVCTSRKATDPSSGSVGCAGSPRRR